MRKGAVSQSKLRSFSLIIVGMSGVSLLSAAQFGISRLQPHQKSLLVAEASKMKAAFPDSNVNCKLYEMTIYSKQESIDEFAKAFFSSAIYWLFNRLPSKVISGADHDIPTNYSVGSSVGYLTVTERVDSTKELYLSWSAEKSNVHGGLYFRLHSLNGDRKVIQYGTIVSLPPEYGTDYAGAAIVGCQSRLNLLAAGMSLSFR